MKFTHRVTEKSGLMGGRSYVVELRVELTPDEAETKSRYGFTTLLELGERYAGTKGIGEAGHLNLDQLISGIEAKAPSIQMAFDLVDVVARELAGIRQQIVATQAIAARLGRQEEIVIE